MSIETGSLKIDTRQQEAWLRRYRPAEVEKLLRKASGDGATAAKAVLLGAAPIGTSKREGQFYRRQGYGHGTFRSSIRAAAIRRRGLQAKTVGSVIGPMGKKGFTRAWREKGTRAHGKHPGSAGTHFIADSASRAFAASTLASEATLNRYVAETR